jgi:long-chain acyl-CoA synthetase
MLVKGIVPHFGDEAERFLETLYEVAPQHHASVPRYWSKLASRVIVGVENSSPLKRAAYAAAMRVGRAYRQRRWSGARVPPRSARSTGWRGSRCSIAC